MNTQKISFLFIHICKCAGSSILTNLRNKNTLLWEPPRNINTDYWRKYNTFNANSISHHFTVSSAKEYLGEESFSKLFKFTFVRNPWSRLVSSYFYRLEKNEWKNTITFSEYIKNLGNNIEYGKYIVHSLNCLDWISDKNANILVDFIGKFENLQGDFDKLCDELGIQRETLTHINQTDHKHYTEYYNEETSEVVAKRYAKDIEYFGYKFGD